MNDVINRKDAIGAILSVGHIAELSDGDAVIRVSAVNYVLRNLPSVKPKYNTSEWCTDCREYDHDKHCCPRYNKVIRNTVEEMKQEPCEDAISRKEALEALKQEEPLVWCDGADEIAAYDQWSNDVDTIKNISPVQPKPKTGQWFLLDECSNSGYYCSECHKKLVKEGWSDTVKKIKYCPNCGCRMVEPQESEETK